MVVSALWLGKGVRSSFSLVFLQAPGDRMANGRNHQ